MMTREQLCSKIKEAISQIEFQGEFLSKAVYGSGHINDTFLLHFSQPDQTVKRYILQRMNHEIFKNPEQLMENIANVTSFLRNKIIKSNGDSERETMNIIPTKDGKAFYKDSIGCYWRGYQFIEKAKSFDQVEKPDDFYQSALAFGHFQKLLSDFPAETLFETIPNFHNTPDRYQNFLHAVKEDKCSRVEGVRDEINFVIAHEKDTHVFELLYQQGKLPLRVTHNDTKLNNVMIDLKTGKGICVIDLDTVMPGFSVNDFGDSIRFGASTSAEDEPDLFKVNLSLELFDLYTKGFLEGCDGSLTETELEMLPMGAKMMTLECGIRFLTDYLEGDTYFRIHRDGQNLDRCRTQFKLVADMEKKWKKLSCIVNKYRP